MERNSIKALSTIYDAALSPDHWPQALSVFAHEIGALGAILIAVDQVQLPFHIETSSYPMDQVRHYFENYGHYDEPVMTQRLMTTPPLHLLRDSDVWPDMTQLEDRPDYKWLRENIGSRRRAGVRLSNNKGWADLLALQFAKDWHEQPDDLEPDLQVLLPHVAKVVEINRQFSILRTHYRAALGALDHLLIGTCITDPKGRIIVANREARRIHDLDDGIRLSRAGHITCHSNQTTMLLADKICRVAATAAGEAREHEFLLRAERRSGKRSFMIELAPLRDTLGELERGLYGAIVFIVDPENPRGVSTDRLAKLFGLTDAETEVCRHLICGLSALEIATVRGVSEETVKSQFKSIYAKTAVHRRAELLRLALTVDPPIG